MAEATVCQTPGAVFETHVMPDLIEVVVRLPMGLGLDEVGSALLAANLHNAVELVLARYF